MFAPLLFLFLTTPTTSAWVHPGPDGKLVYKATPAGDRILDFSHAGYRGGGVALPTVAVKRKVKPSGTADDSAVIQAALDEVAGLPLVDGHRGTVLLLPGRYNLPRPLALDVSGVVLRGSGKSSTLRLTGTPHPAITVGAGRQELPELGPRTTITDAYVPSGATRFTVADGRGFAPGDTVLVRRPITAAWVHFMQMDDLTRDGKGQTWLKAGQSLATERTVAAVAGNVITVDVPLADALDARYLAPTGATVVKVSTGDRPAEVGIETLHIEAPPQAINHTEAHFTALRFHAQDSWARELVIDETMNSVTIGGRRITFERVTINRKARSQGASRPAEFAPNGTQILLDRVAVNAENVWFVATGTGQAGPNVILNGIFQGDSRAEAHQRWSTGILFDGCHAPGGGIELRNRGSMGSGHGWAMGWGVIWNGEARDYIVQSPPGALNWLIGSVGENKPAARPFGSGPLLPVAVEDSPGQHVVPASLYMAQLAERLGQRAVRAIGYPPVAAARIKRP